MKDLFDDYSDDDAEGYFDEDDLENEFSEADGYEDEPQEVKVALMNKGDIIAIIGIVTNATSGILTRVDPRAEPPVATSRCDSPQAARRLFGKSIRSSVANGWQVFYRGVPLEG